MLLRKIDDLERRLSDFGQAAALSASQFKNIEESKIAARREIEDLLKAVREQQKYSEMDRQMHDQLEKAWARTEELEKKLMDFYASVLDMEAKRRADNSEEAQRSAAAFEKAAGASSQAASAMAELAARVEKLEERLSEASLAHAADGMLKVQEEFLAKAEHQSAAQLAAQEAAAREALTGFREVSASLRDFFDNNFRRELAMLNERVSSETDALRREVTGSLEESRKLVREQSSALAGKTSDLARAVDAAREETAAQARGLEEFAGRMDASLRSMALEFLSASKRENDERFSRLSAKYADALLAVTFVENFRASVGAAADRLEAHEARLKEFLRTVSPEQLDKLLGVSGDMIRKEFEAMKACAAGLGADVASLRGVKRDIEAKVRDIFGEER